MNKLPTWVEIDIDTFVENLRVIRRSLAKNVAILLTVKADAYGHGAVQLAQAADEFVDSFGVATLDEALELRRAEVRKKILILSPVLEEEIPGVVAHNIATTVSSFEFAHSLASYADLKGTTTEVHVETDTGMGRTGFFPEVARDLIKRISGLPGLRLGGLFTHFAVSDTDEQFTLEQVRRFLDLVRRLEDDGVNIPLLHSANSAAVAAIPESHMAMVRPGLVAYGHLPNGMTSELDVRSVMSWKSRLVQIRQVPKGTPISYGCTYKTERDTCMGIVPVGYGHGYPYGLSNRGRMIVSGSEVPIMGRVTMDMTMVDLTGVTPTPKVGDEVVLLGGAVSVDDVARWAGTISYEILCGISKRVPRTYLRDGKVEAFKSLLGVIPNHVRV